jgi:methionine aminopeptidase
VSVYVSIHILKQRRGLRVANGKPAAQFEHTVVITQGKPVLVTAV